LEVREFHDVERFVKILRFVHEQRGIPVQHHQVVVVVAQIAGGGFLGFLFREPFHLFLLREQRGDLEAMRLKPLLGVHRLVFRVKHRRGDAKTVYASSSGNCGWGRTRCPRNSVVTSCASRRTSSCNAPLLNCKS
jgi:hypothetical protein